jgi:hypothetical protein
VVILVAVCLVVLCGIAAIALDGGLLLDQRRRAQAAADAAALAAADDLYFHYQIGNGLDPSGTAAASALSTAAAMGYTNDGVTSVVTVNVPPLSGSYAGQAGYAEVVIEYNQPRGFSRIFGSGAIPVTARAVGSGQWVTFNNGIIVLDPTSKGSLTAAGNGTMTVVGASVIVDSSDAAAAVANGNGNLTAPVFDITGVPGTSTPGGGTFNGTIYSGVPPTPDPLAYLPEPDPNSLTVESTQTLHISGKSDVTLSPGVYQGGIDIAGQANVTLLPGIYYMQGGGFSSTGQGNLTGTGILLYNAPTQSSDTIKIAGQGNVNITPMTSGIYQGISIFQERSSTPTVSVTGNGNMTITGTFYAAAAALKVTGNGSVNVIGSQYISYDLKLAGNGGINISWSGNPTARTRLVGLVE